MVIKRAMHIVRKAAWLALALPLVAGASSEGIRLERAPIKDNDVASLQRGAAVFVNYCLNCHSANYMRYNRLRDIGLTEEQIKDNLIFTGVKVGELMQVAMDKKDAKEWFGAAPPDLTVIARSRGSEAGSGADWLYTYLRTFYRDAARPTGWNNLTYPNVAMPHVLWQLSGQYSLVEREFKSEEEAEAALRQLGTVGVVEHLAGGEGKYVVKTVKQSTPGALPPVEYDQLAADLVNYMAFMGEPSRVLRREIGAYVLMFLAVMFVFAYMLKREYWKDVH